MPRKRKTRVSHIPNPHDLAFKGALADIRVARDFFTHHLPKHIQEHADLAKTLLFGPYHLSALHQVADDDILKHQWVGLAEMLLKHAKYRNIMHLLQEILPVWLEPLLTESGAEQYVLHMLNYAFNVGEGDVPSLDIFLQVTHTKLESKIVEKKVMTIAEQLKQAGRQEGRQEGREDIILKMLRKGMDPIMVAQFTDMRLEEVEAIALEQAENTRAQLSCG